MGVLKTASQEDNWGCLSSTFKPLDFPRPYSADMLSLHGGKEFYGGSFQAHAPRIVPELFGFPFSQALNRNT